MLCRLVFIQREQRQVPTVIVAVGAITGGDGCVITLIAAEIFVHLVVDRRTRSHTPRRRGVLRSATAREPSMYNLLVCAVRSSASNSHVGFTTDVDQGIRERPAEKTLWQNPGSGSVFLEREC